MRKTLGKLLLAGTILVSTFFPSFLNSARGQGKNLETYLNKGTKTEASSWNHSPNPFVAPDTTQSLTWNNLTIPQERENYLNQKLAIDKTDTLKYIPGEWICYQFSNQIHENFHGIEKLDSLGTFKTKNKFNIPVYDVSVVDTSHTEGHSVNGILIGDNPLNFNDWYFFEPQTDKQEDFSSWKQNYPGENLQIRIKQKLHSNIYGGVASTLVRFNINEPTGEVSVLERHPNLVLQRDTTTTSVEHDFIPVPENFGLGQNYPNEFNPTTTIPFWTKKPVEVDMDIFNLLGQEVRSDLVKGYLPAGNHRVKWDGKNNFGKDVSSGTYIYRLKAGNKVKSKKMTKIK